MTPTDAQRSLINEIEQLLLHAEFILSCGLTPAAEVGVNEVPAISYAAYDSPQDQVMAAIAATIERCAQRAHDWLKDHGYEVEAIECAAAIRALKSKP